MIRLLVGLSGIASCYSSEHPDHDAEKVMRLLRDNSFMFRRLVLAEAISFLM